MASPPGARRTGAHRMTARLAAGLVAGALLGASVLAGCGSSAGTRAAHCSEGLHVLTVALTRGVRVPDNHVNVLLPRGYCARPRATYPVLYLLHGAGDTWRSWAERTDLVTYAASFPLIVVMPDGGHDATATWYSDWASGTWQEETYVTRLLPDAVRRSYRVDGHRVAIAGLSMGGFGALSLTARHPGRYRAAASFSGAVDLLYGAPASGRIFAALHPTEGTPDAAVWGDQTAARAVWAAHNPTDLAPELRGVPLFLASGTGTRGGAEGDIQDNGAYVTESAIHAMNEQLVAALRSAGVSFQADFYPGGYHGWPYWQADLHWALPRLMRALSGREA